MKLVSACLLIFLIMAQHSYADDPTLVIELIRHGARSDSEVTDTTWMDHDELTPVGMRQHYILGKILANRYQQIFETYNQSKIYVRSTNFNRTLMSANTQLQGIFEGRGPSLTPGTSQERMVPPYDTPLIINILNNLSNVTAAVPNQIQFIPIHTIDTNSDELLYGGPGTCPTAAQWFKDKPVDDQATQIFNSLNASTEELRKRGQNMTLLQDYFTLGDQLVADQFDNRPLPLDIVYNTTLYNDTVFGFQWYTNYVYQWNGR